VVNRKQRSECPREANVELHHETANERIAAFEKVLKEASGRSVLPAGASTDITDLLDTLEKGVLLLTEFMKSEVPESDSPRRLTQIENLLSDEIPMIVADLLPALALLREDAYSRLASQEEERNPPGDGEDS